MKCNMLLILLIMTLLFAGNCFAGETGLGYKIGYETTGTSPSMRVVVAYMDGAGKGFDNEPMWPSLPSNGIVFSIRKVNGVDAWNGDTGWYSGDVREPMSLGQNITVDGIYLWAATGTPSQDIHLRLVDGLFLEPSLNYSLSLVSVPQGVDYTGLPTTWGPETTEIILPFYSTDNGETGYRFQLNVSAVPEPSGVLALVSGLFGLGGMLIRRRIS